MIKLEAVPDGLFSTHFTVLQDEVEVARIEMRKLSLRYRGVIKVNEQEFEVKRIGNFPAEYAMTTEGDLELVNCRRKRIFSTEFIATYKNRSLSIRPKYFSLKEAYQFFEGETKVGSCGLVRAFSRRINFELEGDWPLEFWVFLLWFEIVQIAINSSSSS